MTLAGYIYLVQAPDGLYKIGSATNVQLRIRKLPFSVSLIHTIKVDNVNQAEVALQKRYQGHRVGREWFRLNDQEVAEITSMTHMPAFEKQANKSISIRGLSPATIDGLNAQATRLGYASREAYLQDLLTAVAAQNPAPCGCSWSWEDDRLVANA